jgi:hypothetical protein
MDHTVAEQFLILALNPENGRVSLDNIHFRYSLTGAMFMDFFEKGEIRTENKRIISLFKKNGEPLHDLFADRIMNSARNRRISYWINRMTNKSRFIIREIVGSLEKEGILRSEERKFLGIFPYYRYWLIDVSIRNRIIETLREILLYGRQPDKNETMLLGIVEASRGYKLLSRERGESRILRRKNSDLLKGDVFSEEISLAIKEIQAATIASVSAATAAAHSGQ